MGILESEQGLQCGPWVEYFLVGTRFTVWAMGILDSEQGLQCRHFGVGLVSDLLDRLQRLIRKMRRIEGGIAS